MSSRSLAAARARRAGDNVPPVSGNRPVTSIGSQAAFAQPPNGFYQNMPPPSPNVRIARSTSTPSQNNAYQQVKQSQQQAQNGLPFSKLSISDAIGLITLRLGRVEQWIIETNHESQNRDSYEENIRLPENSKVVDNSVFLGLMDRIETIEKREIPSNSVSNEEIIKITDELTSLKELVNKIADDVNKYTIELSKNTQEIFRFNRELVETKDILKSFMLKYDMFVEQTNDKFSDYEFAITELEKNFEIDNNLILNENGINCINDNNDNNDNNDSLTENHNNEQETNNTNNTNNTNIIVDLKKIIKQELTSST